MRRRRRVTLIFVGGGEGGGGRGSGTFGGDFGFSSQAIGAIEKTCARASVVGGGAAEGGDCAVAFVGDRGSCGASIEGREGFCGDFGSFLGVVAGGVFVDAVCIIGAGASGAGGGAVIIETFFTGCAGVAVGVRAKRGVVDTLFIVCFTCVRSIGGGTVAAYGLIEIITGVLFVPSSRIRRERGSPLIAESLLPIALTSTIQARKVRLSFGESRCCCFSGGNPFSEMLPRTPPPHAIIRHCRSQRLFPPLLHMISREMVMVMVMVMMMRVVMTAPTPPHRDVATDKPISSPSFSHQLVQQGVEGLCAAVSLQQPLISQLNNFQHLLPSLNFLGFHRPRPREGLKGSKRRSFVSALRGSDPGEVKFVRETSGANIF